MIIPIKFKFPQIPPYYRMKLRQAKTEEERDKIKKEITISRIFNPILQSWATKNTTKTT